GRALDRPTGRTAHPYVRLATVGREHAGEGLFAEMELEALPLQARHIEVLQARIRRSLLDHSGVNSPGNPGPDAVGTDAEGRPDFMGATVAIADLHPDDT